MWEVSSERMKVKGPPISAWTPSDIRVVVVNDRTVIMVWVVAHISQSAKRRAIACLISLVKLRIRSRLSRQTLLC